MIKNPMRDMRAKAGLNTTQIGALLGITASAVGAKEVSDSVTLRSIGQLAEALKLEVVFVIE